MTKEERDMKKVAKLFMEDSDRKALELLNTIVDDNIVNIALSWNINYEKELDELNTNEFEMYNDIIGYIFKKYELGKIYEL